MEIENAASSLAEAPEYSVPFVRRRFFRVDSPNQKANGLTKFAAESLESDVQKHLLLTCARINLKLRVSVNVNVNVRARATRDAKKKKRSDSFTCRDS